MCNKTLEKRKETYTTLSGEISIEADERLDDLCKDGLMLIQKPDIFCFGMDAVLLSTFAKAGKSNKVLDLCTGNGVIPILMQSKNKDTSYVGLEIQEVSANLAARNVSINNLDDKIQIIKGDLKEAAQILGDASFNVVTVNPPYKKANSGIVNPDSSKAIARHEVLCDIDDVCQAASRCLKSKGHLFMVHRPDRLIDIIMAMKKAHIEPKRIRMVHPYVDKEANMVLIEGIKGANSYMIVEKPLIVYEKNDGKNGIYTTELLEMYGMTGKVDK